MRFGSLLASLPEKRSAVYTLERGTAVRHSYAALAGDAARAREDLTRWGVVAGARVGIYAPNSYSWLVYDLALIDIGAISVPFTDDFAGKIDDALLARYDICLLLIAKSGAKMFEPRPAHVAFIDADNDHVQVLARPPSTDADVADQLTLAFSSGSAGGLKGLVISRSGVEATLPPIVEAIDARYGDRLLLFLPMSNFQQRTMCYSGIAFDFDVIITDYVQMFAAIKSLHPTILIAPPMFYQMAHTRFCNFPRAKRLRWAGLGKLVSLLPGAGLRRALARQLFGEFYQQFGDSMRVVITGMAPIKQSVARFFAAMQLPLCESYGLVETGSLTYRPPGSRKYGSVGKPVEGVRIELEPDGEVVVCRDRFLTSRYFQCAEGENERTFIAPGRVATGDIGRFDADGFLYLMGRKKELIVTPGGAKIHPEIIEEELNGCPDVAQSVVFQRRGTAQLVCVVALAEEAANGAEGRVKKYTGQMASARKGAPITEVIFSDAAFSTQNGMLRPNMKVDRRAIAAKYNL